MASRNVEAVIQCACVRACVSVCVPVCLGLKTSQVCSRYPEASPVICSVLYF